MCFLVCIHMFLSMHTYVCWFDIIDHRTPSTGLFHSKTRGGALCWGRNARLYNSSILHLSSVVCFLLNYFLHGCSIIISWCFPISPKSYLRRLTQWWIVLISLGRWLLARHWHRFKDGFMIYNAFCAKSYNLDAWTPHSTPPVGFSHTDFNHFSSWSLLSKCSVN